MLATLQELIGIGRRREARAPETGSSASADGSEAAAPAAETSSPDMLADGPEDEPESDPLITTRIATAMMQTWLRSRHAVAIDGDLERLDAELLERVLQVLVAAASADGTWDERRQDRVESILPLLFPDAGAAREALPRAMGAATPLRAAFDAVVEAQLGGLVYAGALLSIDRRKPVNRHYLRYLATRLRLAPTARRRLEQRYRL